MAANTLNAGKWIKAGLATLGAAALAAPFVGAVANPVDPTQEAAEFTLSAEEVEQGRQLFGDWSCSACHVLTDANGHGHIGPSLDGNLGLDESFVASRIENGQGAMPSFGGQMTEEEIALLSTYIMEAKK